MFSEPITFTVNGVAQSLKRVQMGPGLASTYQNADESWKMTISHEQPKNGRIRSQVRVDQRKIVTNPLDSSNDYDTMTFYCVLDRPAYGFSILEAEYIVAAFQAFLTSPNVDKLYGKES